MGDAITEKLSQSLDALIRKPSVPGRGRGHVQGGRGSPASAGRGYSTASGGRGTNLRQPNSVPPQSKFEHKQSPKFQQQARPHLQYQQVHRQQAQPVIKRLVQNDPPTRDIPLAQKLGLSLDDIASIRKPPTGKETPQNQQQQQQQQQPQQLVPRSHGGGNTARGTRYVATGAGRSSWPHQGRGGIVGRDAVASGSSAYTQTGHLTKPSSIRGRKRGRGHAPGRGLMGRRSHAPIHHSYGLDQESFDRHDEQDDEPIDEEGNEYDGANEDEDGYRAENNEEIVDEDEEEGQLYDDPMPIGTAGKGGSYCSNRRQQYIASEHVQSKRRPWNFKVRIASKITEAQRNNQPLPVPALYLPGSGRANSAPAHARCRAEVAAIEELKGTEAQLAEIAQEKEGQVAKAQDLLRQLTQIHSELSAQPGGGASGAADSGHPSHPNQPKSHHPSQQHPQVVQLLHSQPHPQREHPQPIAAHAQAPPPMPTDGDSPLRHRAPLYSSNAAAIPPQSSGAMGQQRQQLNTAGTGYVTQHELPPGRYSPQMPQRYDSARVVYEVVPLPPPPPPQSQTNHGPGNSERVVEDVARYSYEPHGMSHRTRDRVRSPARAAHELERELSRDRRGRGYSRDRRDEYYYRNDSRGRARRAGDRQDRSRSRSREWRGCRDSRRRSRSRSRGRSRGRSLDQYGSHSRALSGYSPARDRWAEPRPPPPLLEAAYGTSARHMGHSSGPPFPHEWPGYAYSAAHSYGFPPPPQGPPPGPPSGLQESYNTGVGRPNSFDLHLVPQTTATQPQAEYGSFRGRTSAVAPRPLHQMPPHPSGPEKTLQHSHVSLERDLHDRRYDAPPEMLRAAQQRADARDGEYRRRDQPPSPDVRDRERKLERSREFERDRERDRERDKDRERERERDRELARDRDRERERDRLASGGNTRDSIRRYDRPDAPRREDSRTFEGRRDGSRASEGLRRIQDGDAGRGVGLERDVGGGSDIRSSARGRDSRPRPASPELGRERARKESDRRLDGGGALGAVMSTDADRHANGPTQIEQRGRQDSPRTQGTVVNPHGDNHGAAAGPGDLGGTGGKAEGDGRGSSDSQGVAADDANTQVNGGISHDNDAYEEEMVDYDLPDELDID